MFNLVDPTSILGELGPRSLCVELDPLGGKPSLAVVFYSIMTTTTGRVA